MLNSSANLTVCKVATLINAQRPMLAAKRLKEYQRALVDCIVVLSSEDPGTSQHYEATERLWAIESELTGEEGAW